MVESFSRKNCTFLQTNYVRKRRQMTSFVLIDNSYNLIFTNGKKEPLQSLKVAKNVHWMLSISFSNSYFSPPAVGYSNKIRLGFLWLIVCWRWAYYLVSNKASTFQVRISNAIAVDGICVFKKNIINRKLISLSIKWIFKSLNASVTIFIMNSQMPITFAIMVY